MHQNARLKGIKRVLLYPVKDGAPVDTGMFAPALGHRLWISDGRKLHVSEFLDFEQGTGMEGSSLGRPLHRKKSGVCIALEILQEVIYAMLCVLQQSNGLHLSEVWVVMVLVDVFPDSFNAVQSVEN